MLKTFEHSVPTMWNLNRQCVDPFEVADNALKRVLNVLEMLVGRKNGKALTQSKVLDFVGWSPFCMREEFDQHRAKHPELEPMPPLDHAYRTLDATKHVAEAGGPDQGGVLQTPHLILESGCTYDWF